MSQSRFLQQGRLRQQKQLEEALTLDLTDTPSLQPPAKGNLEP